jgi:hypothetical protein
MECRRRNEWHLAGTLQKGDSVKAKLKEWLRRWWIRQLIKFADRAEERLQDWQVSLRKELSASADSLPASRPSQAVAVVQASPQHPRPVGIKPVSAGRKNPRRRITAAEFDLRYAR